MRVSLLVSVALNLLLLATIVLARVDHKLRAGRLDPGEPDAAAADIRQLPLGDAESLVNALRAAGIAEGDIKAMVAGWLETRARNGAGDELPGFWRPEFVPGAAALATELAVAEAVQRGLLALYGEGAAEDAAFRSNFRPLGPAFAFLSPAEQRALRQHQLERASRPTQAGPASARQDCVRVTPAPAEANAADADGDELASVLTGAAYDEYRVRFSPLSSSLRRTAVASGESEFRELFGLLRQLELARTPAAQLELRRALRSRMGSAAFDRLWSDLDPLYQIIGSYLAGEGFADAEIANAYSIINRGQESLLGHMSRGADQAGLLRALARQREAETAQLNGLLGEPAARGLMAAVTAAAMRLGEGADCAAARNFQ